MSVIKIENLVHDYGGGKGVFDISFHVNQGEAFGFLGPNGAGKTTTIRHLMGFSSPGMQKPRLHGENMLYMNYTTVIHKRQSKTLISYFLLSFELFSYIITP